MASVWLTDEHTNTQKFATHKHTHTGAYLQMLTEIFASSFGGGIITRIDIVATRSRGSS